MYIARRDLWFARGRFALMGGVVVLLALLMVLLTGLSTGLVDDNVSGIRNLPASHFGFNADAGVNFNRSTVTRSQWEKAAQANGVAASAPMGESIFNAQFYADAVTATRAHDEIVGQGAATTKGTAVDIALFGMEPGSFIAPSPTDGQSLGARADGVLASEALVKKGVHVGDTIVLDRVGTVVTVIGTTAKGNYGHVPVLYAPLALWQEATFGPPGGYRQGETRPDSVGNVATLVALNLQPGSDPTAIGQDVGLTVVTRSASFAGSPGYKEETGTLVMIEAFLYAIAALLVGAFFTVWTIQRTPEIGLLKALGGSNRYVIRDALSQAAIVLFAATAIGVALGVAFGFVMPTGAPFALQPVPIASAAGLVILMGLIGAGLSVRRIAKIDPLLALGGIR